ncbi:MAG: aldehyde ferredoxin oxidoreductase N-terminal domain-containing protein [Thermodesulfobacteriota bacterium]|nr:aldehyde ferredoxin oxidoreductase N-terminal domain-containing protein [Thermodesulfobacteriota bacterium]
MEWCGYAGKNLSVDLSTGKIKEEESDPRFLKEFVGGYSTGLRMLYDLLKPGTDPLSPENILICTSPPLTGTQAAAASRWGLLFKQPLNGCVGMSAGGMWFGTKLKQAGFDHLIIRGKAEKPVYLKIMDEDVEIVDAGDLWGKDIFETSDELKRRYGQRSSDVSIGPAGEHLVRLSIGLVDKLSSIGKGGGAAVMGSKNLKAIVIDGTRGVKIKDPEGFLKITRSIMERIKKFPKKQKYIETAQMYDWEGMVFEKRIGIKNKSEIYNAAADAGFYSTEIYKEKLYKARTACPSCPIPDKDILEIREGKYAGLRTYCSGFAGRSKDIGVQAGVGVRNYNEMTVAIDRANRYGISTHIFGPLMDLYVALYREGIITSKDTDGMELKSDFETVMRVMKQTAYREGIGDTLADGYLATIKRFGPESEKHVHHVKNMDCRNDPRCRTVDTGVFATVTNPKGGHGIPGDYSPAKFARGVPPKVFEDYCIQVGASPEAIKRIFENELTFIPRLTIQAEEWWSQHNMMGTCMRAHIYIWYSTQIFADLYTSATGFKLTREELKQKSIKAWNLLKAINVREGQRSRDRFPPLWYTPIKGVDGKDIYATDYYGKKILTPEDFELMLDDYYRERGWDIKTGIPTKEKLEKVGLADIAAALDKGADIKKR